MLVENIHHRLLDCMPMSKAKTIFKKFLAYPNIWLSLAQPLTCLIMQNVRFFCAIFIHVSMSIILTTIFKFSFSFAKTFDFFGKLL